MLMSNLLYKYFVSITNDINIFILEIHYKNLPIMFNSISISILKWNYYLNIQN